jgi:fumarate reductase subunit D
MSESFFDHGKPEDQSAGDRRIPELDGEAAGTRPSEEIRMSAVLAYIPFLCFIPLVRMREDQYLYFHARQGLILFFIEVVAFVFSFPHLSQLFWTVIIIACIGAAVAGVWFAVQGRMHKLPLIGDLADRLRM